MRLSWKTAQEIAAVLRPTWLAAVIVAVVCMALHTPQAMDVLVDIQAYEGLLSGNHLMLVFSVLTLAICGWYFARALLYVRYWITPQERALFERWRRWYPRVLGVLPLLSLSSAFARGGRTGFATAYLVLAGSLLVALTYRRRLFGAEPLVKLHGRMPAHALIFMSALLCVSLVLLIVFFLMPVTAPQIVGPISVLFLALASWIAFGSIALVYPTYRFRLPSLLVVVLAVAMVFSAWNDNHRVRTLDAPIEEWRRPSVEEQFLDWWELRRPARDRYADAGSPYPLFVVAAEGGGIRAACWTASVLARLEEAYPGFACHVFAISGVSGGSYGGAVFAGLMADHVEASDYRCDSGEPGSDPVLLYSARRVLGEDFLAPALAGMFYPDFLQRFLPFTGDFALPDRAEYLELAWEKAWERWTGTNRFADDLAALWDSDDTRLQVPSLFLNGTWVENGGRHVTSNLRPVSTGFVKLDDAFTVLGAPLRLSTAVHMSARFTYVSPAGTVKDGAKERHVVDGGYFENSGALTASEIAMTIEGICDRDDSPCADPGVAVHAIIITNSPANPSANPGMTVGKDRPNQILAETLSPVKALYQARAARGYHAEQFLTEAVDGRVLRYSLRAIGDKQVPLGWMPSAKTRAEIDGIVSELDGVDAVGRLLGTEPRGLGAEAAP